VDGDYAAHLQFADGTPALASFDAHGHFDSDELTFGIGLGGQTRTSATNLDAHRFMRSLPDRGAEFAYKERTRIGGDRARTKADPPLTRHQMFGLTIVSGERGAIRQTADGLMIYGREAWRELEVAPRLYAANELDRLYDAWINDRPLESHDGRWGKATTELCFAILESTRTGQDVVLRHQVPYPPSRG